MTNIINIIKRAAKEDYWSPQGPTTYMSCHMYLNSPFESSDSCDNCNGARCNSCVKVTTPSEWRFSVSSNTLYHWIVEEGVDPGIANELAYSDDCRHTYKGYHLVWPTEDALKEEHPNFYAAMTTADTDVLSVIESYKGKFEKFIYLKEAVLEHYGLKGAFYGHVVNQLEMYWIACDYDHKKACGADPTVVAELTAENKEEKTMNKNIIRRSLSPKGYNHGCADYAVFEYSAGDAVAVCIEATSCHECWQVGHDENHVYAVVGETLPVEELLASPDLDPLYSEEDVEYFLNADTNWEELLLIPTVTAADAELSVYKEEEGTMYDLKFDHGIEISMIHNPEAGCNSGEYHTLYIKDMEFDACRCGNGCYGTVALNRLDDKEYVLFLLGEVEFDPREESVVEREYLDAKERLERRGINPDEVKYFTHSTEPTGLGPIYKFVIRSFVSPMTLREENKKILSALVEQKKNLSDFRDADIVEVFETYNFDTAIDIMDTLTDLGYFKVYDLFREDDFEEEGGR